LDSHIPLRDSLKEWAVAVRALERGETALVIRKGGIREKAFAVPSARFLLLPGYEHQRPDLVKPEFRALLDDLPERSDTGPLHFTSFAEVVGAYEISEKDELDAMDEHHMWTPEYAESRFKWRPKKPLTALVLRTHLLPEEIVVDFREEYGGCKSWISLAESVPTGGAYPALSDAEFEKISAPVLTKLEEYAPARIGS
jgi:hypothetical protein